MRLVIAFVALVLVGCGNAPVSVAPSSPSARPSASVDVFKVACSTARDDIAAISDLMGAMLTALTQGNSEIALRYRDDVRAAATNSVKRLPEGYGAVTALLDYSERLRDVLASLGPTPDPTRARDATVKLVAAGPALATCSSS